MDARYFHRPIDRSWLAQARPARAARRGRGVSLGGAPTPEALALLLLRVAANADKAAFGQLFDHFAPRLKSYMLRLGAGGEQAEELAQETMLLVWHKAGRFDPARAGAATWIFTIARNLRIDALRRERPVESLDETAAAAIAGDDPGAEAALATRQAEGALRAALAGLTAEQAMLVQLSFFDDNPHSAISKRLQVPLGTVKSRLRRIIGQLRAAMEAAR